MYMNLSPNFMDIGEAMANVQGIRENQDWKYFFLSLLLMDRFTVLSLDTKEGKYYIKK